MTNDSDSPQVLVSMRTDWEAQLLVNHLETIGIKAVVSGARGSTYWLPGALCAYHVVVRRADLERARQELASTVSRTELKGDTFNRNAAWVAIVILVIVVVLLRHI